MHKEHAKSGCPDHGSRFMKSKYSAGEKFRIVMKSFNFILEREVIKGFEFSSFENARNIIFRFIELCNNEGLHSGINYNTPREVYEKWKESIIEK